MVLWKVTTLFSFPITWQTQIQDCSQEEGKGSRLKRYAFQNPQSGLELNYSFFGCLFSVFCFKVNRVFVLFYSFLCLSLPSFVLYLFLLSFPLISLSLLNPQRLWLPPVKDVCFSQLKRKKGVGRRRGRKRRTRKKNKGGGIEKWWRKWNEFVQIGHHWMVRLLIVLFLFFVNLY